MMDATVSGIAVRPRSEVAPFHPEQTREKLAGIEGDIVRFRKLKQWPQLQDAVQAKITEQRNFVVLWDNLVFLGRPKKSVALAGHFSVAQAEAEWGISKSTVSRWRGALLDPAAYAERIIRSAYRIANLAGYADPSAVRGQHSREGEADFWPTPQSLINACMDHVLPILPAGPIWECAAGDGRLVRAIATRRTVYGSDLYPQDDTAPVDFLSADPPRQDSIVLTNPPYNQSDAFITRGLDLLDSGLIAGLVLLLRHDHLQASGRVDVFNQATVEVHCNWRPIWIDGSEGQPRWSFHWIAWLNAMRRAPLYLREE